jgi:hypothetical protein
MKNQYGLDRNIPAAVKREVRQRSRFGCVVCRRAIYQYEHIDPEFYQAREHDPERICLLCGACHDKVTCGRLSKATVAHKYNEIASGGSPKSAYDEFDLSKAPIVIKLGSAIFSHCEKFIEIDGKTILAIRAPEGSGAPPLLSGIFTGDDEQALLSIQENVWTGSHAAWDIECVGTRTTIRKKARGISLQFRVDPPHEIHIERLDMRYGRFRLRFNAGLFSIEHVMPDRELSISMARFECLGSRSCIQLDSRALEDPNIQGLSMVGGEGVHLVGTGIKLGVGSGRMCILGLKVEDATRTQTTTVFYPLEKDLVGIYEVTKPRLK